MKFSPITYNHMALMFLRIHSHVKASTVLTRVDHLCIGPTKLYNITSKYYLRSIFVQTRLELASYYIYTCVSDALPTETHSQLYNI